MDLTSWLEFFAKGLATQLQETIERGRRAIRVGVLTTDHQLNDRQLTAIEHLQDHALLDIEQFEAVCPGSTRRTLQRDLKRLVDVGILQTHGEARATRYSLTAKYL